MAAAPFAASVLVLGVATTATVFTAPTAQAQAADEVSLRPNYAQGSTSRFTIWTDRTTTMTISDGTESQELETLYHIEGEISWTIRRARPDGSAECVMVYDWLVIDVTGPDGSELKNDSRRSTGDAPPLHDLLKAIAGTELTFTMAADGSVDQVRGVQAIRAALDTPEMAPEDAEFLDTARTLAVLDAAPEIARNGASWRTNHDETHELGEMERRTEYRLEDVSQVEGIPVATIAVEETLSLTPAEEDVPAGITVNTRLTSAESQGTVLFDLDRSEAVGRHHRERTVIERRLTFPGQTMTQTIEDLRLSQLLRIEEQDAE